MTYKLEEFKAWLEADPARNEGLTNWLGCLQQNSFNGLVKMIDIPMNNQPYNHASHQPYQQVIKKWIAEIDHQREREREQMRRYPLIW